MTHEYDASMTSPELSDWIATTIWEERYSCQCEREADRVKLVIGRRPKVRHTDDCGRQMIVVEGPTTEDVYAQLAPFIRKYSRWNIRGFDYEDLEQEVRAVIYKCHLIYKRKSGTFLNLIDFAVKNRLGQLLMVSRRTAQPPSSMKCRSCGAERGVAGSRTLCACGERSWDLQYGAPGLVSIDASASRDSDGESYEKELAIDTSALPPERLVAFRSWVSGLQLKDRALVVRAFEGERLRKADRERLLQLVGEARNELDIGYHA